MELTGPSAQISIGILTNLLYDLGKHSFASPTVSSPLDRAIMRTAKTFEEFEDLRTTLNQWLLSKGVLSNLEAYASGTKGLDDLQIPVLAQSLLEETQFFSPNTSQVDSRRIVEGFLAALREEYLRSPDSSVLHVANRIEASMSRSESHFHTLSESISRLTCQTQLPADLSSGSLFDSQLDAVRTHIQNHEYDVAVDACRKLEQRNWDVLSPRQKFRTLTNWAVANYSRGELDDAARRFIQAKEFQPDDPVALANEARGYQILGENHRAFELADAARYRFPQSAVVLAVWIKAAPPSTPFQELESAVPPLVASDDPDITTALSEQALLRGMYAKAEELAKKAALKRPDWSYLWVLLAEGIMKSELPQAAEDYGAPVSDLSRLLNAEEICTKAYQLAKVEKTITSQATALLVRANVRRLIGNDSGADQDVIAAWSLDATNPVVLRDYARLKLLQKENGEAIKVLRSASNAGDDQDLLFLLAIALSGTGAEHDLSEGADIFLRLLDDSEAAAPFKLQVLRHALDGFVRQKKIEEGRRFLSKPPIINGFSAVVQSAARGELELAHGNIVEASELASSAISSLTAETGTAELRATATLLMRLGRHSDALPLWQRLATSRRLDYDTTRLIDAALRLGKHDIFLTVAEELRSNGVEDSQLVKTEADILTQYDVDKAIALLNNWLERSPTDQNARLQLSTIGLREGRTELVVSEPASMPRAEDVSPGNWCVMVQVMRSGGHHQEALRFAYALLRRHFDKGEAHRAYIASMMPLPATAQPDIPEVDAAGPGTAIAFTQEGTTQVEWRIIEDEFEPDGSLNEIRPEHFIATQVNGKRAGDHFVLAQGSVTSTRANLVQVLSKFVYRYQESIGNWQMRFPELPFVQIVRTGSEKQPDLSEFFFSLDRIAANREGVIAYYRDNVIPIHAVAEILNQNDFDQTIGLAVGESVQIKCCFGSAGERTEAISSLKNAKAVVLDMTALATIALLELFKRLRYSKCELILPELVLSELLTAVAAQPADDCEMAFLGSRGAQHVFEKATPEMLRSRREFLQSVIDDVRSHCTILPCPSLASVSPETRERLTKMVGMHGAQGIVLASVPGRVLWTDDLATALIAKHEFGVRRVWTQVVLQERTEAGALEASEFFDASAKLIGCHYYFTSPSPAVLEHAARLAAWNPDTWPLRSALNLIGDEMIAASDAISLSVAFLRQYASEVVMPEVRSALTVRLLTVLSKRRDAVACVQALALSVPVALSLNPLRAAEIMQTIQIWSIAKRH